MPKAGLDNTDSGRLGCAPVRRDRPAGKDTRPTMNTFIPRPVRYLSEDNTYGSDRDLIRRAMESGITRGAAGIQTVVVRLDGAHRYAQVTRISAEHTAGWRVTDHVNRSLIGTVAVYAGPAGRYARHGR